MIKLYGVPLSPYYNKVKIALMEKGVKFDEVLMRPPLAAEWLDKSPMGKIPFVEINGQALSESTAVLEWLEDAYPTASLLPLTPNSRALAREIMLMVDLYLGPACRPVVRHRLFGAPLDSEGARAAGAEIRRVLAALARRAQFAPWLAGDQFSYADISAAAVLPVIGFVAQELGEDLLASLPGAVTYQQQLAERYSIRRTWADREAAIAALLEAKG
jgi:glutathione S-transferase